MKGIILAGGSGSRLRPLTAAVSKQLLPIYDKPMIYYPLSTLMLAGIRDILVVSTPHDLDAYRAFLGDGEAFGVSLSYAAQPQPGGLAQAFLIGRDFLAGGPAALALGDNLHHGEGFAALCAKAATLLEGAAVFAREVDNPEQYGVVSFDEGGAPRALVEKPKAPESNWAVTGLYFYGGDVVEVAASLKPSARGELEITDLNRVYLARGQLRVHRLDRRQTWMDAGTPDRLLEASLFVRQAEQRLGIKIGCPEEIAFRSGWLDVVALLRRAATFGETAYATHLRQIARRVA